SYAARELNDALAITDYASVALQPTELYAPASVAANDVTVQNLDALVSGLATRFGESSLTTEVNTLRARYLAPSGKRVYAEAAFRIRGNPGHAWALATRGRGGDAPRRATPGFEAGVDREAA